MEVLMRAGVSTVVAGGVLAGVLAAGALAIQDAPGKVPPSGTPAGAAGQEQAVRILQRMAQQRSPAEARESTPQAPVAAETGGESREGAVGPARTPVFPEPSPALSIFGMSLFVRPVPDLVPDLRVPVSPDYVLGPGDTLIVHYWTATEDETFTTEITRDGTIAIPAVGEVDVAQLTYEEARTLVEKEVRRTKEASMVTVRLGPLRSIHVWVTGHVRQLGLHTISALSTAFNALLVSGGPTEHGSLRRIEIKRGPDHLQTLDLYDFLLRGDRGADIRLQSGDTIFVPVRGPRVHLEGEVKSPAIYELDGETTLAELLEMAGGFTGHGYRALVQLERTQDGRERVLQDVLLEDLERGAGDVVLRDGDVVRVFAVGEEIQNRIDVEGNIERPGRYEWHAGMMLSELLERAGPLLAETHMKRAEIRRVLGAEVAYRHSSGPEALLQSHQVIPFDLAAVLAGTTDLPLERLDHVVIYRRDQVRPPPTVAIEGAVRRPGTYELTAGMRVKDLVFEAGGELDDAFLGEAVIVRRRQGEAGAVTTEVERLRLDLNAALLGNERANLLLENFDTLIVRRRQLLTVTVEIRGSVRHPGHYILSQGARVSDLLAEAGGALEEAFLEGAIFARKTVREKQAQATQEYVRQQRERLLWLQSREVTRSSGAGSEEKIQAAIVLQKQLLDELAATPIVGRLPLQGLEREEFAASPFNVTLVDGDLLDVPERPASVLVIGHVTVPGATLYVEGSDIDHYLRQVGGLRDDADEEGTYVIKADGSVVKVYEEKDHRISWDSRRGGWFEGVINEEIVQLGDMIYVPPEAELVGGWDMTRDIVDIVFKTAVAAGVVVGVWR
ncbi:MAG: SLBB domain-containing protein [Planctomycetota bacterium]